MHPFLCIPHHPPSECGRYVGESAKNIEKVFAEAKGQDAVLVFDEAEGLFAQVPHSAAPGNPLYAIMTPLHHHAAHKRGRLNLTARLNECGHLASPHGRVLGHCKHRNYHCSHAHSCYPFDAQTHQLHGTRSLPSRTGTLRSTPLFTAVSSSSWCVFSSTHLHESVVVSAKSTVLSHGVSGGFICIHVHSTCSSE